jgi:hypothetical protein
MQRMPPSVFDELHRTMPAVSWQQWMEWSKSAGLW